MVPSLPLLSCKLSVSVKKTLIEKKKSCYLFSLVVPLKVTRCTARLSFSKGSCAITIYEISEVILVKHVPGKFIRITVTKKQKQPLTDALQNRCFQKNLAKFSVKYRKTPVLEFPFGEGAGIRLNQTRGFYTATFQ